MKRCIVLWLLLSLLVTGCVSVPTDGPVVEGRPAGEPVPPVNVAVIPTGPRPGDEPVAIVEGFLSSMASFEPGYRTAREFLTPEAATRWRPESGIAVYGAGGGSRRVSATDQGVKIALALVARVAEDGSYTPSESDTKLVLDLTVRQVDGEWRIDNPPDGLVMTAFDFRREFASFASYFFDPDYSVLVPDLTYLPVRGNLPTLLVEELLDGPTVWLEPAVRSAIDPGVRLISGSAVQTGTVVQVDLSPQVAQIPDVQRDRLAAQLAWTLRQAPGVAEVAVLAGGQPLPLPNSQSGIVSADSFAFYDPASVPAGDSLYAVSNGGVVRVRGDQAVPVRGPLGDSAELRSVGVSLTGTQAAAVTVDGARVSRSGLGDGSVATTFDLGGDLGVPSFDRGERVWLVDRGETVSTVYVLADDGEPTVVRAGSLERRRVERLHLAPDGVRVAVVYRARDAARLALALVLREPDGTVRLGRVRDIALDQVEALDVAWASATALALLGAAADGAQPFLVELSNGALSSRGQVPDAAALAASPGQPLVIGSVPVQPDDPDTGSSPVLLRQDALQEWVPVAEAQAPTYPG